VTKVLLADDQSLVRAGFRLLIESAPDLDLVGEAADGEAALALAREVRPDVVLMDIRMPVMDGLEATRRIAGDPELAACHVLVLTTYETDEYIFEALRCGVSGFLLKDAEPAELLQAIRVVAAGDALLAPSITRRIIASVAGRPAQRPLSPRDLKELTEREREVLTLVGQGKTNDEIASELFVSPATVKTHVSRVMSKLYARDRAQLVVAAYESGLVVPGV
jgi:DNA-binding NarL/FixJ family response regulator